MTDIEKQTIAAILGHIGLLVAGGPAPAASWAAIAQLATERAAPGYSDHAR